MDALSYNESRADSLTFGAKNADFSPKPALDGDAFYRALNSAVNDAATMKHILDVTESLVSGMDFGSGPNRNTALDQVAALIDVCRGLAEKICDATWPESPLAH
jgi:hypothetical protein